MIALDLKDRKILHQLDINCRRSDTVIGKTIGLSSQVIGFRIRRLLKNRIVQCFYTVIDLARIGFTSHKNFLRLQNCDRQKETEIIDFLKSHPNVLWVASCDGRFDLAFGTWARDVISLNVMLREFQQRYGMLVSERQIAPILRGEYFVRDYLIHKEHSVGLRKSFFGGIPTPSDLDLFDWKILHAIGANARMSAVEVSARVGLKPDAIIQRIRRLEKSGVIRHYNFVPNESAYPYLHYKVLVGLRNLTNARESALMEFCRMNPNIVYICKVLGPWDIEVDMEVETPQNYRDIMMEIKNQFSDVIKDYSALQIYQVHKYNFCPSIPK